TRIPSKLMPSSGPFVATLIGGDPWTTDFHSAFHVLTSVLISRPKAASSKKHAARVVQEAQAFSPTVVMCVAVFSPHRCGDATALFDVLQALLGWAHRLELLADGRVRYSFKK